MIKIKKSKCPEDLTEETQKERTTLYCEYIEALNTYKEDKVNNPKPDKVKDVWKMDCIEESLLESSHDKCCFCECRITEESKYLEIEHFFPKSIYPEKVVEWDNLLPSCKRCNGAKGDLDPEQTPIVNPSKDLPNQHLYMFKYRLIGLDNKGENTWKELKLNDRKRLQLKRCEIGGGISEELVNLLDLTKEYNNGTSQHTQRKNRIVNWLKNILLEGDDSEVYAATVCTEIMESADFNRIREIFKNHDLWDNELDELFEVVQRNSLHKRRKQILF